MKIELIKLDDIDVPADRMRPTDSDEVIKMAADIADRDLRQAIEVSKRKNGRYRLVSGGHRLAAYRLLEKTEIEASLIEGNRTELKRDELMENLARKGLTKLERAQFMAELKRVHMELHEQSHGGKRQAVDLEDENSSRKLCDLNSWYDAVAKISPDGIRTIQGSASIGEKLSPDVANKLRGTPFANNQQQLGLLCKLEPKEQQEVADLLIAKENPAKSVKEACARIGGRTSEAPKQTASEKWFAKFEDHWAKCPNQKIKQQALQLLIEMGEISPLGVGSFSEAAE